MADLIAEGTDTKNRWRRTLPEDQPLVLGRTQAAWAVPWDDRISRRHVELRWRHGTLKVQRLATARNPVFVRGQELDEFELQAGECFVIGQTTFTVVNDEVNVSLEVPQPIEEQTFTSQHLEHIRFRNAEQRLEALARMPEVISGAGSDSELFVRLANLLLAGIRRAEAVAIVAIDHREDQSSPIRILHWDRRLAVGGAFEPSQRLILEALRRQHSVLHVWGGSTAAAGGPTMTWNESYDWAFCTPIVSEETSAWAIYVTGRFSSELLSTPPATPSDPSDLREELKFTELVAAFVASLRQVRALQQRQASLSPFFAPQVLEAFAYEDPEVVFRPRETEVTVLFCDLRGFSAESERHAHRLLELLERVSDALGVMTHDILQNDGVVGDFHGDAAMGFWGWPLPQPDKVERACRAALGVRDVLAAAAQQPSHALSNFRMGIGIATGTAVAGKIGTIDQVKVTVFGPVVNLASRLEGMTKILRTPILMDSATAQIARQQLSPDEGRFRRLAVVRPFGLDTPVEVTELLPPESDYPLLTNEHLALYEQALDAFKEGRWSEANELLHGVPAGDRAKDFLTVFIAQHDRMPPANWDGVVPLDRKS